MSATRQLWSLHASGRRVRTVSEVVARERAHHVGVAVQVTVLHDLLVPAAAHGTAAAPMAALLMKGRTGPLADLAKADNSVAPMPFPWEGQRS